MNFNGFLKGIQLLTGIYMKDILLRLKPDACSYFNYRLYHSYCKYFVISCTVNGTNDRIPKVEKTSAQLP